MALTCSEAEREVDEKEVYGFEFELNDESFKAIVEVVETFAADSTAGEDGIGLFIKDGETIEEATLAVFNFTAVEIAADIFSYGFGLIDTASAERAGVDLDKADNIGIKAADEIGDFREVFIGFTEHVHPGFLLASAGTVTDIIEEKTH